MSNERVRVDDRLRDALRAASRTVPDDLARPRIEALDLRASFRPPWPLVALVAAVAVALAVAVPYGLLRGGTEHRPVPAQTPTVTDPPPLRPVVLKPTGGFHISLDANVRPDAPGYNATVVGVKDPDRRPKLPGSVYTSVAMTSDGLTFYLARSGVDATCTADVLKLELADDGSATSLAPVPNLRVPGHRLDDLQLSPDGKQLAMTVGRQEWQDNSFCDSTLTQPDLALVGLATGARRTWTQTTAAHSAGGHHNLAWSFDGESIVFPWPVHPQLDQETVLRKLDITAAEGPIESASDPIPRDENFHATGRTSLTLFTAGLGAYPRELVAFQPQGGSRILAIARHPPEVNPTNPGGGDPIDPAKPYPGMVEISLVTGKIRDVPR